MELKQIYTPGLAVLSYVISGQTSCIVVDPTREISQYIQIAKSLGRPITAILETHLHADFISGHRELARMTGAKIYISQKAGAAYPHYGMQDNEVLHHDIFEIRMLDTPGHTPEASVFVVSDLERGPEPTLVFTGDTVLIGDVGRPDLFPKIKNELAEHLYQSLRRIEGLSDYVEMYPAHGAGSLCGKKLSAKLTSTIGIERLYNIPLNTQPVKKFMEKLLWDMPEVPDHFSRCSEMNRLGPSLSSELTSPKAYKPKDFAKLIAEGCLVVDTRPILSYAAAHIPKSYGLTLKENFSTLAGWVLPPDQPLLLVTETKEDLAAALQGLYAVGLDHVIGYLEGGMASWLASGRKTTRIECISAEELNQKLHDPAFTLIDTRLKSEYNQGHIFGAVHVPAPDVRKHYSEWKDKKNLVFICSTGNRSQLAASLMLRLNSDVKVFYAAGGMTAWEAMGYPVVK